ncbi:hypothetical protein, partial [Klebsiella pneumoniae]|uniref:hypothetical protein n=1 Tax=Klebsiella pneumoniae TaxID=573 RepID=UPI003F7A5282
MSFFSFLLGAFLAVTCCLFVFIWHKKQSTKKNLKQYQPVSIDSSVKNAKTLLNAADHSVVVKFFWTRRSDGRVMHRRATGRQGWPAFRTVRVIG